MVALAAAVGSHNVEVLLARRLPADAKVAVGDGAATAGMAVQVQEAFP
jgi:hypothetical protein